MVAVKPEKSKRLKACAPPHDKKAYDEAGNLIWEEDEVLRKAGVKIQYVYDGLNRLREIVLPRRKDQRADANTVYEYGEPGAAGNAANRITKVSDESGTVEYGYGKLGQTTYEQRVIYSLNASRVDRDISGVMEYLSDYLGRMEKIVYPDGETVSYYYDHGGQIQKVSGTKPYYTEPYEYVKDIGYDEYGQRVYIEYGNGVKTSYTYDPQRRWLQTIETNRDGQVYQNIAYDFDLVGNVEQYENAAGRYSTSQSYSYDDLYQLIGVEGNSTQYRYSGGTIIDHQSRYEQSFSFDEIGNMTHKTSGASITNNVKLGSDLNYEFAYEYYEKNGKRGHQAERIGDMYYRYDGNGNVVEERFGGHGSGGNVKVPYTEENGIYSTPYAFILTSPNPEDRGGKTGSGDTYRRDYVWDYQNRLIKTQDPLHTVQYRYGADGQRAVKYSEGTPNETLYFNNMWQMGTSAADSRWLQSKHIFVGETRIATKNGYGERNSGYETEHQYWYHGDHLGSAQVVTDYQGELYERIEYTPYGETWIEHKYPAYTNTEIPYRFTSKELDPETGLYYYGARYLDPRTSRWISGDPAVGEYIPEAPVDDEAKKRNGNLPGGGGIFNLVNLHVYHYAGNNPVKYVDPDGEKFGVPDLDVAGYFDNVIQRGLSLPGIAIGNMINSAKNFFSNIGKGEGSFSVQLSARLAGSKLNLSLNFSEAGISGKIDPSVISQLEAVAGSPVRTKYDKDNNLNGLEFHIGVGDAAGIGKISAILGGSFDTETGDATTTIGAKLSGLGETGKTSLILRLSAKASTIGDSPTVQGRDFANNFNDSASKAKYNEVWTDRF